MDGRTRTGIANKTHRSSTHSQTHTPTSLAHSTHTHNHTHTQRNPLQKMKPSDRIKLKIQEISTPVGLCVVYASFYMISMKYADVRFGLFGVRRGCGSATSTSDDLGNFVIKSTNALLELTHTDAPNHSFRISLFLRYSCVFISLANDFERNLDETIYFFRYSRR